MSSFLYALAGIVVGGIITFFVSRYYYRRAGEELRREAAVIRRAANMVIIGLVESGHIDPDNVRIDPDSRLVDFVKVHGEKMRRMTMTPEERATMYKLLSEPLPPEPSERSWWKRLFGG